MIETNYDLTDYSFYIEAERDAALTQAMIADDLLLDELSLDFQIQDCLGLLPTPEPAPISNR